MDTFELGNFRLANGYTIPNARLAYTTHGTLNAARDNAVVFPNFLGGNDAALEMYVGEGMALDPNKYFVILPGQFGNGFSSSPSNTPPPFDRGAFPPIAIADDVIAQHRLITEHFGIERLALVLGWSVGALQTYEWAVRFPDVVTRMASIAGAPRPSPWTLHWLRTVIEEPIVTDPAWNNGFYAQASDVQAGLRRQGHCMALTLPPLSYYHGDLMQRLGFGSVQDFVRGFFEGFMVGQDPNNLLIQARKALTADPAQGGSLPEALGRITAKTTIVAFTGDVMFPPQDNELDARNIPGAKYREVTTISGHLTTFGLFPEDKQAVDDAIREALAA
ncbi:MAG: alpha/beta fold hydrolase [Rhodospirillales bacterium]